MVEVDEETDSLRMVGWGDGDVEVPRRLSRSSVETSETVLFGRKEPGEW